jgi:hypothetical protein
MPDPFDARLRSFVADHIHSVAELELLLLLRSQPEKSWAVAEMSRALALAPEMTAALLDDLRRRGFAVQPEDQAAAYRYSPAAPEFDRLLGELARYYEERRVSVIQLIYAQPIDKLRTFADAFRLRRPKEEP